MRSFVSSIVKTLVMLYNQVKSTSMVENCACFLYRFILYATLILDRAIRARDKPGPQILKQGGGYGLHRDLNEKSPRVQVGGERRWSNHGYRGSSQDIQSTYHSTQTNTPACNNTGTSSTETMSKVLTIANLPSDMSPKELYEICSAYGSVDRSYIYQQADQFGRRFGEVTMGTYFFAHKVSCFPPMPLHVLRLIVTWYRLLRDLMAFP